MIDLSQGREAIHATLLNTIVTYADKNKLNVRQVAEKLLGDTIGNTLIDDELEESLVMSIATAFDVETKNPQHDLNGGYEGNNDDDDDDE